MTKLKILYIVLLALILCNPIHVSAQQKSKKTSTSIILVDDDNTAHSIPASGIRFSNKSGNFLWTIKVKVPANIMENIDFSPYANSIKVIEVLIEDTNEHLVALGYLNKAGNLNIELHKNGSGTFFPNGWFQ